MPAILPEGGSASTGFACFVPAAARIRELTPLPLIVGTLLGIVFGASSLYLVLKVGLTVSASIPVAVISLTLFRLFAKFGARDATILQHNIVQTAGSAGESIAFGIGVTMPAILILGFDLEISRVLLVSVLGGLLGILMMIPLRRALIVEQHGRLPYPEGTACAEVLKAGCTDEDRAVAAQSGRPIDSRAAARGARIIFTGFGIGIAYKVAMVALKAWKDVPQLVFGRPFAGGSVAAEISPELLGVGYIIGPRIASTMCAGGVLAYLVLIPAITQFAVPGAVIPPGTVPISDMSPDDIRGAYILYIGAGAVAAGGIVSMFRSMPTIWRSIQGGWSDISKPRTPAGEERAARPRTDRDLSPRFVAIGLIVLMAAIMLARPLHMNFVGAILIVLMGFLFVTVSSRLTGEVGSTSNPISGMTVATLLGTCLIFLALGWTGPNYYVTALSVGAIVCIASSNGGTTSQDLKTGYLVGATPRSQQIAILVGALASAIVLGPVLITLNNAGTVLVPVAGTEAARTLPTVPPRVLVTLPEEVSQGTSYRVWRHPDAAGTPQRYLVDGSGRAVFLVDPGINGTHRTTAEGAPVQKFDAPKATLMSYIIKGILNHELPWGLVLLGVMITVVLEMAGVSSLVFAVGLYLPLSSSAPIFIGGLIRAIVDRRARRRAAAAATSQDLQAEGDSGPGVLLASGYIAGGAIAGIVIAFMSGVLTSFNERVDATMRVANPFYGGDWADAWSLLPFLLLVGYLYFVAAGRQRAAD